MPPRATNHNAGQRPREAGGGSAVICGKGAGEGAGEGGAAGPGGGQAGDL